MDISTKGYGVDYYILVESTDIFTTENLEQTKLVKRWYVSSFECCYEVFGKRDAELLLRLILYPYPASMPG